MLLALEICLIICLILFLSFIIIWKLSFNYRGEIKLNLKTFKQIYYINPNKWSYFGLWCDDVKHLHYRNHRVKLTFFAFCWFLLDRAFSKYRENKKEKRNNLIWLLQDCQEDIESLKKQADRDIERALKAQKRILNNWR